MTVLRIDWLQRSETRTVSARSGLNARVHTEVGELESSAVQLMCCELQFRRDLKTALHVPVGDGLDAPLRHCKSTWLGERR